MEALGFSAVVGVGFVLAYYLHKFAWKAWGQKKFSEHSDEEYTKYKNIHKIAIITLYSVLITLLHWTLFANEKNTFWEEFRLTITTKTVLDTLWAVSMVLLLFLGAIVQMYSSGILAMKLQALASFHSDDFKRLVAAPLLEEWIFRDIATLTLIRSYSSWETILISSCTFSLAHAHNFFRIRKRVAKVQHAVISTIFQMTFTFLFGLFCCYFIIKTESFYAAVLLHAICNFLGFPPLNELMTEPTGKRIGIIVTYITGIILFFYFA